MMVIVENTFTWPVTMIVVSVVSHPLLHIVYILDIYRRTPSNPHIIGPKVGEGMKDARETTALDYILTNSLYIICLNFPGTIHALSCYCNQVCGYWGGFCNIISTYTGSREWEESLIPLFWIFTTITATESYPDTSCTVETTTYVENVFIWLIEIIQVLIDLSHCLPYTCRNYALETPHTPQIRPK